MAPFLVIFGLQFLGTLPFLGFFFGIPQSTTRQNAPLNKIQ